MKKLKLTQLVDNHGCLSEYDPNALTYNKAVDLLKEFLIKKNQDSVISIEDASGFILAKDIKSPIDVPNYNNSAMDGYVFKSKYLKKKNEIKVAGQILAGHPVGKKIATNECFQIMTGGMIPKEFDTVIPQEFITKKEDTVFFDFKPKKNANIRLLGEDIKKGEVALKKGTYLNPCHIGLIASLGIEKIRVFKPLNIGFFSTGDEVKKVGSKIKPGEVYDSNRYLISSMIKNNNYNLTDYGNLSDDKKMLQDQLKEAARYSDVVVTTGGVSVGEADFMKEILSKIGQVLFWKMSIKPGRPMAFGKIKSCFYFGLPGNPVSAAVTFLQFVQPSLKLLSGSNFEPIPELKIKLSSNIIRKKGRKEFLRGLIFSDKDGWKVRPLNQQGSGMLKSMSDANCFIIINEDVDNLKKDDLVVVQPFHSIF